MEPFTWRDVLSILSLILGAVGVWQGRNKRPPGKHRKR